MGWYHNCVETYGKSLRGDKMILGAVIMILGLAALIVAISFTVVAKSDKNCKVKQLG